MNYQDRFNELARRCHYLGLRVKLVPSSVLKDYAGMNYEAAKKIGFPMKKKEILISRDLSDKARYHTLRHELIERDLMINKKVKYWPAHVRALALENPGRIF